MAVTAVGDTKKKIIKIDADNEYLGKNVYYSVLSVRQLVDVLYILKIGI